MRFSKITSLVAAGAIAVSQVNGLNILITNDDGFGVSMIREMYKAVKAFGHNVYIVASTYNASGTGGTVIFTTEKNLTANTEFDIVKAGAPSVGHDPLDDHIWYYNGTPSAVVQVALDYVLPKYANFSTPDLVMSGPNFGLNLGPFLYTLSGTIGATYTAVERGIPGIAYSGAWSVQTPYFWLNTTTKAGLPDPATIYGRLAANLAQTLIKNSNGTRLLPLGYGISVNLPYITSFDNASCINPPFVQTRMTGGAVVDGAGYNNKTGLFSFTNVVSPGLNQCINGDCSLPGETNLLNSGCFSSVSVFSVDYDAPTCSGTQGVRQALMPLAQYNGTNLVGGLNGTTGVFGALNATSSNSTTTTTKPSGSSTATAAATFTGAASGISVNGAVVLLAGGMAAALAL